MVYLYSDWLYYNEVCYKNPVEIGCKDLSNKIAKPHQTRI
jgi:hypothetical protein